MNTSHKFLILILFLSVAFGCTPLDKLRQDYEKVVYFNGISRHEAITIAQMTITNSIYESYFYRFPAEIVDDEHSQKYLQYWFVEFSPEITYDAPSYLVLVDKKNGEVAFHHEYWPKHREGYDWVFQWTKKAKK